MGIIFMNTSLAFLSELELLLELLSLLDPASTASKRYRSSVSSASISHSSSSTRYWCIDCAAKIPPLFITIKLTQVAAHALFYNHLCVAVCPYSHDMSNEHVIQCKYDITKRLNIWTLGMFQTWSCIEKTQLVECYHACLHIWHIWVLSPLFDLRFRVLFASNQDASNLLTKLLLQLGLCEPLPLSKTFLTFGLGDRKINLGFFPVPRSTQPTLKENWVEISSSHGLCQFSMFPQCPRMGDWQLIDKAYINHAPMPLMVYAIWICIDHNKS